MALPRLIVAIAACALLAGSPVSANEIQEINQQFRKGDLAGALAHTERYLAKNPKDAQARFLKGLILADQGKTADAIQIFRGLTEDYPELPEPYNNLAVLYASQSKYEDAKNALEMAIRTHPSYATAHENLGDIYAKLASLAYDKALQLDTSNATAQTKLALIKDMIGGDSRKSGAAKPAIIAASMPVTTDAPPAVAVAAAPAARGALEALVGNWARAWSAKNVDAYLAFYAPDFSPAGQTRSAWESQRRSRISAPKSIDVQISNLKIEQQDEDRATARFRQAYRSDRAKSVDNKILTFARQNGQWRIVGETTAK